MIVMKFGGTSTKDASAMLNVTKIITSHLHQNPIVVISAIAQATNMLEAIANFSKEGNRKNATVILEDLIAKHKKIIQDAIHTKDILLTLDQKITEFKSEIEDLINGVAILKELTPKSLDKFYSYGELLSSLIISYILNENNVKAVWLDTKDFMITDSNYNRAQPIMHIVKEKLIPIVSKLVSESKVPVTQGFIGATITGERTTMGRESSDYSASVIGAVLNVQDIQIWTDVDGVLTGDPNIVKNPKKIRQLSFEEAYQLSFFGAKVLHPNTMIPAQEKNIPIHVFNSKRSNSEGTLVTDSSNLKLVESIVIKSVTYKSNISLLTIQPKSRFSPYIFWEQIFSIINKYKITPLTCSTLEYVFSVAFESKYLCDSVVNELDTIGKLELKNQLALISIIGQNLNKAQTLLQMVVSSLENIKILHSNYGSSDYCFSIIVNEADMNETICRLHNLFFDSQIDSDYFDTV